MKKFDDPINEADVYLAYGRKAEAEQLLEAALKEAPMREDLRVKLANVKISPPVKNGLSNKQITICFSLLFVSATLKFLNFQPWLADAGSWIGFCVIAYMAVSLAKRKGR